MPRFFGDYNAQVINTQNFLERERRIRDTVDSIDPGAVRLMAEYARWFPSTPSGITRALAQSGIAWDHPVSQFVINQNQRRLYEERGSWDGRYGTIQRPQVTNEQRNELQRRKHQAFRQYEAATTTNTDMQDMIKEAETRGVYSPSTGMLIEPDNDAPMSEKQWFSDLANKIYTLSGTAVPFLSRSGSVYGWDPSHVAGRYPIDPTTGQHIDLSDPAFSEARAPRTEIVEPGEPLHDLGIEEYQFTELGEPLPQSEASVAASEALIAQIYSEAEARSENEMPGSLDAAMDNVRQQRAAITPSNPGASFLEAPIRALGMVADAPLQELQGLVRNLHAAFNGEGFDWNSQSDLGVVLPRLVSNLSPWHENQRIDLGGGFLTDPDSAIARERRTRERDRGQIGGHNITAGRWLADLVTEPDTKPFQLMSGLVDGAAQVADPSAWALGKVGTIGVSMRTFQPDEAAGTFRSFRQFFHGPTAERWLDNNGDFVQWLADTDDPFTIAKRTNLKIDPEIVNNLANIPDTHNLRRYLTATVERGQIRRTTQLQGTFTERTKQSWSNMAEVLNPRYTPRSYRAFQQFPAAVIDLEDQAQTSRTLMNVIHNAHGSEDDLRTAYNAVARATTRNGLRNAVYDVFDAADGPIANSLRSYGLENDEVISYLTRINRDTYNEDLRGLIDEVGADVPTWEHMTVGGKLEYVTGPHLPMEHISRFVGLPDQRAIRRLTTKYPFLTAKDTGDFIPGMKGIRRKLGLDESLDLEKGEPGRMRLPLAFMDGAMSRVLKPAWLLRLAWPIRVIGEEQLRMAAAGLDSAFSGHPLSWLAFAIGTPNSRLASMMNRLTPGLEPAAQIDASGEVLNELDELHQVTFRAHGGWLDNPGTVRTNLPTVYTKDSVHELADFRRAWANEISLLNYDPVSNFIANNTMDDAVEWLYSGPGRRFRRELADAHPGNMVTRDQVRNYVQTVSDRIHRISGGNAEVLDMIKSGKFTNRKGVPTNIRGGLGMDKTFTRHLETLMDAAPQKIRGTRYSAHQMNSTFGREWNGAIERMMGFLMGTPTSTLSRAPAFKQYLWQHVGDLLPFADSGAQARILANAEKANLPSRQLRYLRKQAARAQGKLGTVELNDLAKGYALDDTKKLLYDVSQRGQISDILRIVVPFAEAWKEVIGRWSQLLITRGGEPARRLQQIIQGARGEALGDFLGNPGDEGFFYTNEFGEEVFAYPGSQWLLSKETNIPGSPVQLPGLTTGVPMTGRVQGLNMFGSIFPSLGPVAQIPVAVFLQDKPQHDWWREQLLPFGGPGAEETSSLFELRDYLPGYMKTAVDWVTDGGTDDRIYNSSVMYVAAQLHSTGEYGNSIEEQQRLMEDAKDKAQDLYAIRAFGQFMLPASPSPNWLIQDESGRLFSQRILAEQFYADVAESGDYQATVTEFLDTYGTEAIGAIIPHSRSVIPNVPTTLEAAQWVADNPDVKKQFPLTYGLFAPAGGEFDIRIYVRNFISEERDAITPEQWENLRDNTLANYFYELELAKLGENADSPTGDQEDWLRARRESIQESFPNWGNRTGLDERPETEVLVRDLYRAAEDDFLTTTEAGRGLRAYLALRDQAQAQAEGLGLASFRTSKRLSGTRDWLRSNAQGIIEQYPAFKQVYDFVLSRELTVED